MTREENITRLCEKTGASREDVIAALNACGDDVLDAALYLEALGKVYRTPGAKTDSQSASFTAYSEAGNTAEHTNSCEQHENGFGNACKRFLRWCGKIIKIGNENFLEITRHDECLISIPLTVMVLLLIPFFWLVIGILVVGLFFDFQYRFYGPKFAPDGTSNRTMNKASNACSELKQDFQNGFHGTDDRR